MTQETRDLVPAIIDSSPNQLIALALERQADPATLKELMDLHERWEAGQARKAYVVSMAAFKREAPAMLHKNDVVDFSTAKGRTNYRYANLGSIVQEITALLGKHDLSASWSTAQNGPDVTVTCFVTHTAGHREGVTLTGPIDESGNKNKIQAVGSTVTYLQRYTLLAALGLATGEDDDGRGGAAPVAGDDNQEPAGMPACPKCGLELRRSKLEPEYYCWDKKGGCGSKYPLNFLETGEVPFEAGEEVQYTGPDYKGPADAEPSPKPNASGKPKLATANQKAYLFGGGKTPMDQALAIRYMAKMGGGKGIGEALEAGTIPGEVAAALKYQKDGKLSWSGTLTEVEAKVLIDRLKTELGIGEPGETTAMKAFWAKTNEHGLPKAEVHTFFRVSTAGGALGEYIAARAKRMKISIADSWKMARNQIEKAVQFDALMAGVPEDAPAAPPMEVTHDIEFE